MEIQNLTPNLTVNPVTSNAEKKKTNFSFPIFIIILVVGITSGFWISRFKKPGTAGSNSIFKQEAVSTDNVEKVEVGKLYGNQGKNFKDTVIGTIEKGSINGEGTHTLIREGGKDQRAALTSSAVDLDLFVGKKVEIKGETNSSTKAGWFLDVGTIKILE